MTRTVIVSHSHPALRYGGGEVAAYRQYEHMLSLNEDVFFVGSTIGPEDGDRYFGANQKVINFSARDFCLHGRGMEGFIMEHFDIEHENWIFEFLLALKGDVYHLHHVWNIGSGTIRRLRAALPQAKFIFTIHEFTAICALHGQMVKRSGELCYAATEVACSSCMQRPPIDFALRKSRMMELLNLFDYLLSPSEFLRDRFEAWGIAPGHISVIENGLELDTDSHTAETEADLAAKAGRFAFFGQATPTKGLDVLVKAAALIEAGAHEGDTPLRIDVHGVDKDSFRALWPDLHIPESIRFCGRYRPQDCVDMMRNYGWIVIPSVWWENSPVVIQEARAAGTPMIASGIGGMAEKTKGWSLQFRAGDVSDLARVLLSVHGNVAELARYKGLIKPPMNMAEFHAAWSQAVGYTPGAAAAG